MTVATSVVVSAGPSAGVVSGTGVSAGAELPTVAASEDGATVVGGAVEAVTSIAASPDSAAMVDGLSASAVDGSDAAASPDGAGDAEVTEVDSEVLPSVSEVSLEVALAADGSVTDGACVAVTPAVVGTGLRADSEVTSSQRQTVT